MTRSGLKVDEADRKAFEMIVEKQVEAGITEEDLSRDSWKMGVKATEEQNFAALTKSCRRGRAAGRGGGIAGAG